MKRQIKSIFLVTIAVLLAGCAVSYKNIATTELKYPTPAIQDEIKYSYQYDVLRLCGNERYAKAEIKKGIRLIAIEVTNLSDSSLRLSRDYDLYLGQNLIQPLNNHVIYKNLKQATWPYYLYMLLSFINLDYTETNSYQTMTVSIKIGFLIGSGITLGNVLKASNSNKRFSYNLQSNYIWDREIKKRETVYGLIGIESRDNVPIQLIRKQKLTPCSS